MARPSSSSRIYVGNLPENIREGELRDLFSKYGRIRNIDIKVGRTSNGTAYAFIEFDHVRDAEDAVDSRDGYRFCGSRLRVEFTGDRRPRRHLYGGGAPKRSEYRVIVTNLPTSASWQDLKDHMRSAGEVGYANIEDNRGIVEYSNEDDMRYAIKKLDKSVFQNPFHRATIRVRVQSHDSSSRSRSRSRSRSYSRSYSRRKRSTSPRQKDKALRRRSKSPRQRRHRSRSYSHSDSEPRQRSVSSRSHSRSHSRSRSPSHSEKRSVDRNMEEKRLGSGSRERSISGDRNDAKRDRESIKDESPAKRSDVSERNSEERDKDRRTRDREEEASDEERQVKVPRKENEKEEEQNKNDKVDQKRSKSEEKSEDKETKEESTKNEKIEDRNESLENTTVDANEVKAGSRSNSPT